MSELILQNPELDGLKYFLLPPGRLNKIEVFMKIAANLSTLSTCSRLSVGAVIVDTKFRVVGMGYNGMPKGHEHCKDRNPEALKELCCCIHAEQNAILNATFMTESMKMAFVTAFPCGECLKLLSGYGVTDVVYYDPYRYFESCLKIATDHGIRAYHLVETKE